MLLSDLSVHVWEYMNIAFSIEFCFAVTFEYFFSCEALRKHMLS